MKNRKQKKKDSNQVDNKDEKTQDNNIITKKEKLITLTSNNPHIIIKDDEKDFTVNIENEFNDSKLDLTLKNHEENKDINILFNIEKKEHIKLINDWYMENNKIIILINPKKDIDSIDYNNILLLKIDLDKTITNYDILNYILNGNINNKIEKDEFYSLLSIYKYNNENNKLNIKMHNNKFILNENEIINNFDYFVITSKNLNNIEIDNTVKTDKLYVELNNGIQINKGKDTKLNFFIKQNENDIKIIKSNNINNGKFEILDKYDELINENID